MSLTTKRGTEIPTIDVAMVCILVGDESTGTQIALDTASQIGVETATEVTDAVKLVIKNKLKAQKPQQTTITGTNITLTDNVFIPEVVKVLQGGTIEYDTSDTSKIVGYTPPVAGSGEKGVVFTMIVYSAQYDESGQIVQYERITYPNCQGTPVSLNSEDNVFRVSEYTITSAPRKGQAPYAIKYVDALPVVA